MSYKHYGIKINKTIALLTFSDIFIWGGFNVVSILAGIYLSEKIGENAIRIVGVGMAIYLIFQAVAQIPIGIFLDKIKRDYDDILVLFLSGLLMGSAFIFYPLIKTPNSYYFLQALLGIGASMNLISWRKLFAENLKKGKSGLSYGIYGTAMGIFTAGISLLGGFIANMGNYYFDWVMFFLGIWVMLGGVWGGLVVFIKKRKSDR